MSGFRLEHTPVHLGLGATCVPLPPMDGPAWYERYGAAHAADGVEGRLVSMYTFERDWGTWEMHPSGSELVLVVSGRMTLIQRRAGEDVRTVLGPGEAAINPPGVWHTAAVGEPTTAVFITAGAGTENAPTPPPA
ncbi:MAG: cupin domain-containing protein [Kofleriaceae bacterium]